MWLLDLAESQRLLEKTMDTPIRHAEHSCFKHRAEVLEARAKWECPLSKMCSGCAYLVGFVPAWPTDCVKGTVFIFLFGRFEKKKGFRKRIHQTRPKTVDIERGTAPLIKFLLAPQWRLPVCSTIWSSLLQSTSLPVLFSFLLLVGRRDTSAHVALLLYSRVSKHYKHQTNQAPLLYL